MRWAARRALYWQSHERRCARCGTTVDVVLHHLRYDWPLGAEPDETLMPLCRRDHLEVHELHRRRPHADLEKLALRYVLRGSVVRSLRSR
jgi:5-methylcytosine-specific restriction endonuclease McrA